MLKLVRKSDIMAWCDSIRNDAEVMLKGFIESVVLSNEYNDEFKINGIKDIYKEYQDDLFDADIIQTFWWKIEQILSNDAEPFYMACCSGDIISFIQQIYDDDEKLFINTHFDKIHKIMLVLSGVKDNYPSLDIDNEPLDEIKDGNE